MSWKKRTINALLILILSFAFVFGFGLLWNGNGLIGFILMMIGAAILGFCWDENNPIVQYLTKE